MANESIESILMGMNNARQARIAARMAVRDSIFVSDDYDLFDKLLGEAHTKANDRLKKSNEPDRAGSSDESSETADGAERSKAGDDA
jgi:hypothetical protein